MERLKSSTGINVPPRALLVLFLGLAVLRGGPSLAQEGKGTVLATVNGEPITTQDFLDELGGNGLGTRTPQQARALLDRMIRFRMIYAAAIREGYDKDPEVEEGLRMLIVNKYVADHLGDQSKVSVPRSQVEQYYREHPDEFTSPGALRAAAIIIPLNEAMSHREKEMLRRKAEAARAEALKLPPSVMGFGNLASRYSADPKTREQGGDLGWLRRGKPTGRWPKAADEALFALTEPGSVSRLVSTTSGFYLFRLIESREGIQASLADAAPLIQEKLARQRKSNPEGNFLDHLKNEIPMTVDEKALQEFLKSYQTGAAH